MANISNQNNDHNKTSENKPVLEQSQDSSPKAHDLNPANQVVISNLGRTNKHDD